MDRVDKSILLGLYAAAAGATAGAVLLSTGTGSDRYNKVAKDDPTGIVDSNIGRGLFQLGRALIGGVVWPLLMVRELGQDSRRSC